MLERLLASKRQQMSGSLALLALQLVSSPMSTPQVFVRTAVSGFDKRVAEASADSWSNQSPCAEWTARHVVEHVANNLRRVTVGLGGAASPEVDPVEDIVGAWNATRDGFLAAVDTADMEKNVDGPMGPMPAGQLLQRLITTDVLIHTWDLARAVGGDESLSQELVEGAYGGLKPMDTMIRRPGVFGDKAPCPVGADLQTEFLTFLGRSV